MKPSDFPHAYKVKWVRAYPLVAGMPAADADLASPAELDEAFGRVLANRWLRRLHEDFLAGVS